MTELEELKHKCERIVALYPEEHAAVACAKLTLSLIMEHKDNGKESPTTYRGLRTNNPGKLV